MGQCYGYAGQNDLSHMSIEERMIPVPMKRSDVCSQLRKIQENACQCVPTGELDARLQTRVEDFYQTYDKEKLNKKGRLKDKKLWKAYKGKRPQMYYSLLVRYRKDAVQLWTPEGERMSWEEL